MTSTPGSALDLLIHLLGLPCEAGWRLHFPADESTVTISVRPAFGTRGAVWFDETGRDGPSSWWIPLGAPGSLHRLEVEVKALISESDSARESRPAPGPNTVASST